MNCNTEGFEGKRHTCVLRGTPTCFDAGPNRPKRQVSFLVDPTVIVQGFVVSVHLQMEHPSFEDELPLEPPRGKSRFYNSRCLCQNLV